MNKELISAPIIELFWELISLQALKNNPGVLRDEYSPEEYKALYKEFKELLTDDENEIIFRNFHLALNKDISLLPPDIIGNGKCLQEKWFFYPDISLKELIRCHIEPSSEESINNLLTILLSNFNHFLGNKNYTPEKSCANLASFFLSIIVAEKEFDAIYDLENWLYDEDFTLKKEFTIYNQTVYKQILECYWYLGEFDKCVLVHKKLYGLEDQVKEHYEKMHEMVDETAHTPLEQDYRRKTSKFKAKWTFTQLVQAANAFRLKLITREQYDKAEKRLIEKEQKQKEIDEEFKEKVAAGRFLKLEVDDFNEVGEHELVKIFKLKAPQDKIYKVAFSSETNIQLTQDYSLLRLERLILEFFHIPSKKQNILAELEYLKVINPPWFKSRTGDTEQLIKRFSEFEEDYIKDWFKIIAKIDSSSTTVLEKVYILYQGDLMEIRKDGITKNLHELFQLRTLPISILATVINNGNYEPTKEEIDFHLWVNEDSQHITNKVLDKVTGDRFEFRRLSLSNKLNLERIKNILNQVFREVEEFFERNVKEKEKCFVDHELFIKLLSACVKMKEPGQAKYWFDWYDKIKNKHKISGQGYWSKKIAEEYNKLEELLQQLDVCSFSEARAYAQSLNLKNKKEWQKFCAGPDKPINIPAKPEQIYKENEWTDYSDFLGLNNGRKFKNFKDAREFVRSLGLKSENDWRNYKRSGVKPDNIPAKPENVYIEEGWCGFMDWLGYTKVQRKHKFADFVSAKIFIHSLGLKSEFEWEEYKKTGLKPADIPADPEKVYKEDGWCGFQDWLGFSMTEYNIQEYATAKELIRRLAPEKALEFEVEGWPEFKNPRATVEQGSQFREFTSAREFVRTLNLKSAAEWRDYNRSGKRPVDIPAKPDRVYKTKGWVSFPDWMGYETGQRSSVAGNQFKDFIEAREFARSLNLRTEDDWRKYKRNGQRPSDIPAKPENVYKDKGWKGYGDWLRTG